MDRVVEHAADRASEAAGSEGGKHPVRVLYMDDDPGIGRLVQRHLERAGYRVRLAPDGETGLALENLKDESGMIRRENVV